MVTVTISRGVRDSADNPARSLPGSIDGVTGVVASDAPRMLLICPGVGEVTLPLAPTDAKVTGYASSFGSLDRPGRRPIVYKTAQPLKQLTLSCVLKAANDPIGQKSIEDTLLKPLTDLVSDGSRVFFIQRMGFTERGGWRCADAAITVTRRQAGTNHVTRATIDFTFLENYVSAVTVGGTGVVGK